MTGTAIMPRMPAFVRRASLGAKLAGILALAGILGLVGILALLLTVITPSCSGLET
jgi:hypothetical protein